MIIITQCILAFNANLPAFEEAKFIWRAAILDEGVAVCDVCVGWIAKQHDVRLDTL